MLICIRDVLNLIHIVFQDQSTHRQLVDKIYEKRKQAALDLEKYKCSFNYTTCLFADENMLGR